MQIYNLENQNSGFSVLDSLGGFGSPSGHVKLVIWSPRPWFSIPATATRSVVVTSAVGTKSMLGGPGGMPPRKILKSRCSEMHFPAFSEQNLSKSHVEK